MNNFAIQRIEKDFKEVLKMDMMNDSLCSLQVVNFQSYPKMFLINVIIMPHSGAFKGYKYKVRIHVTDKFPFQPIKMISSTKLYHPNINQIDKQIYLKSLDEENWNSTNTDRLYTLMLQLRYLFVEPDMSFVPQNPENIRCGLLYNAKSQEFFQKLQLSLQELQFNNYNSLNYNKQNNNNYKYDNNNNYRVYINNQGYINNNINESNLYCQGEVQKGFIKEFNQDYNENFSPIQQQQQLNQNDQQNHQQFNQQDQFLQQQQCQQKINNQCLHQMRQIYQKQQSQKFILNNCLDLEEVSDAETYTMHEEQNFQNYINYNNLNNGGNLDQNDDEIDLNQNNYDTNGSYNNKHINDQNMNQTWFQQNNNYNNGDILDEYGSFQNNNNIIQKQNNLIQQQQQMNIFKNQDDQQFGKSSSENTDQLYRFDIIGNNHANNGNNNENDEQIKKNQQQKEQMKVVSLKLHPKKRKRPNYIPDIGEGFQIKTRLYI
ncbi:Ubiquitin-conjugating enzyme/RWD-like protein [Pseudocohnilembus persalinus]|uniref:Ubiquitin-conjugating enzyme/RWD-like protein n=1 Tax=Pseudocohnilembus persalinus TaxID=266149 RepID=A0A0V0R7K5_PSEPJ|nr:Ubiquitin-conjugating enzyme/RWD-like protein [Pseudocohnilembus persalinus]|eukprot:KRX10457.1 Ubiquitin-conjugating enzyme/RWD-like protein [Pseudocohnilembus persalinus]